MKEIHCPHDRYFKASMANLVIAKDFFKQFLPAHILSLVNLDDMKLCPNTYIDENLKLTASDVLYSINISGRKGYLYVICEHQSSPDPIMALRCCQYGLNIAFDHIKQQGKFSLPIPYIFPVVVYHGSAPYNVATELKDVFDLPSLNLKHSFASDYGLINFEETSDEALEVKIPSGIIGLFFKHAQEREYHSLIRALKKARVWFLENNCNFFEITIQYWLNNKSIEEKKSFMQNLAHALEGELGEKVTTIAEELIQEGMQKGREEGMAKGILTCQASMLLKLLHKRFRVVPVKYQNRIGKANSNELSVWLDKILEIRNIEDLFVE